VGFAVKLIDFQKKHFKSRALCAEAFSVSIYQFNNMVSAGREVEKLSDGRWILTSGKNKIISTDNQS